VLIDLVVAFGILSSVVKSGRAGRYSGA